MTVQTNTNVASFNGNGVTQIFPIAFKFSNDTDLVVLLVDDETGSVSQLTLNSDYTVSGEGDEEGGLINVLVAPVAGTRLQVTRVVDILQLTDLRNQGKFFAEVHEDAFDLLTMIAQQHESGLRSSLRVAESDPEPARIPAVAQRAGKILSFDIYGNPVVVAPVSDSSTALRLDLASDDGAGMIGFNPETAYPAGTMGSALEGAKESAVPRDTATGAAIIPAGTSPQRPAEPVNGMFRYNSETGQFEGYQNGAWAEVVDVSGLADDVAQLESSVQELDADIAFTIIYPNGGSAASPANVSTNSRYVMANPFPGHAVICEAQIYTAADGWHTTGWFSTTSTGVGVRAAQCGDDVVVAVGITGISFGYQYTGGSTSSTIDSADATPRPCRVRVWKVKGALV